MTTATLIAVLLCLLAAAACLQLGRLDNRLGGDMILNPRPSLHDRMRHWLGLDDITHTLRRIEDTLSQMTDLFNGLVAQQAAASAAQATSFHNIDAAFKKLQDEIANGNVSPEIQAAADQLSAGFASLQKAAEDEGRLYQPADDNGDQPVDNGGDTPPADGGDTPVDNGGDVPPMDNGDGTGDVPPVVNNRRR